MCSQGWGLPHPAWGVFPVLGLHTQHGVCSQGWGLTHPTWGVLPGTFRLRMGDGVCRTQNGVCYQGPSDSTWGVLPGMGSAAPSMVVCRTQHGVCSQGCGLPHPAWGVFTGMWSAAPSMGCVHRDVVCRTQHGVCSQGCGLPHLAWGVFTGMWSAAPSVECKSGFRGSSLGSRTPLLKLATYQQTLTELADTHSSSLELRSAVQ